MTDQPTNPELEPTDLSNDLATMLIAEGILDPSELQVSMVVAGMVKETIRTAFSMTVGDAENLVKNSSILVKEAMKRNDPHLSDYRQGEGAARAWLKFRRDLERLRS